MCLASTVTEVALGSFKRYMNKLKAKNSTNKEENNNLLAGNLSWVWVIGSWVV
jgi:hypothetical protein